MTDEPAETSPGTEVWFRNPDNYIRELVEVGQTWITWDRGLLIKKRIDPDKHAQLFLGTGDDWRVLLVGEQGTAEITAKFPFTRPKAVYPTWCYGEDAAILEEIIADPVGNHEEYCLDMSVSVDERPVWQQEHRVVVTGVPPANTGPGRQVLRYIKELQEDYPECIVHIHGLYGWRPAFGLGFRAADVEPRTSAQKGKIILPSGKEERYEEAVKHPHWITQLGYRPVDLSVPRVRCMFNIKSAVWAAQNYNRLFNFNAGKSTRPTDTTTPTASVVAPTGGALILGREKAAAEGDMIVCDSCSLIDKCKYAREGAVCSMPGSEQGQLARFFKTRDSGMIVDGLGELMRVGAARLERGLEAEETWEEIDPEVSKQLNSLFDQGVKLAKLVDPNLRGGAKIQINTGSGSAVSVGGASPQELVSAAIRELQAQGIERKDITPKMIESMLSGMVPAEQRAAIPAAEPSIYDVEPVAKDDEVA